MNIQTIELTSFRGYEHLVLSFEKGLNVLVGENGAGKTNLAEAISFLSLARSFRTNEDRELKKEGANFAKLTGRFDVAKKNLQVEMILSSKGKKIRINGHDVQKLSELVSQCHVITFQPKDTFLFDSAPSERRRVMNVEISRKSFSYLNDLNRYEKILTERNNLLKAEQVNRMQLDVLTDLLIDVSERLEQKRQVFFQELEPALQEVYRRISLTPKQLTLKYQSYVPLQNFKEQAKEAFSKALESDLRYRMTTIGSHRVDFTCELNGREISSSGSQGEKRLVALMLKLAFYQMVKEQDNKPILILDDVLSELDEEHQRNLLHEVAKYEQVILTTTDWKKEEKATIYDVVHHKVTRRNTYGR